MFTAMSKKNLAPLGLYIDRQLKLRQTPEGKPWSIRELARRSKLSNSGLSVIMRGLAVPDTGTIEKIATALAVPIQEVLVAAGMEVPPEPMVDRSAAYIARRLSELPEWLQEQAIDATGKLVDAYTGIAENGAPRFLDGERPSYETNTARPGEEEPDDTEMFPLSSAEREIILEGLLLYIERAEQAQQQQEEAQEAQEEDQGRETMAGSKANDTAALELAKALAGAIKDSVELAKKAISKSQALPELAESAESVQPI